MSAPYSLVAWTPWRLVEVRVECSRELNASRTLHVLEHDIKKAGPLQFGKRDIGAKW